MFIIQKLIHFENECITGLQIELHSLLETQKVTLSECLIIETKTKFSFKETEKISNPTKFVIVNSNGSMPQ